MKSYINKFLLGTALVSMLGFGSCVGDLNQTPEDPSTISPDDLNKDPKELLGGVMAKCYLGLAVSGQYGPNGSSDISGLDGGTSQWSRAIFMLNEFTTDEVTWIWPDAGVYDLCTDTWSSGNANIFGTYSRLYTHIAVCNDFLRLARDPGQYNISVNAELQKELDQFMLEARALRGLSYYYIIDFFGNAVRAWDDMDYLETPPQRTRKELFDEVVADLEDVVANWPTNLNKQNVVYGRIGLDAVQALLCKYYLNAETWIGEDMYAKVMTTADEIIKRHQGGGFVANDGTATGLANDYLAVFCGNNDMFMPGGSLSSSQNEILWGIPYDQTYTQPYGGTTFMIAAPVTDTGDVSDLSQPFMAHAYYGANLVWTCMHARQQFSQKFEFSQGISADPRTYLWVTERQGFNIANNDFSTFTDGYPAIKFTNCMAESNGNLPRWNDPSTGFPRVGVQPVVATATFPDTDLPIIRLADVYLMYSEAALRSGTNTTTGLNYVNYVRQRANNTRDNVNTGISTWNTLEYTLDNLLDERARELYWENVRRTDLIRFGKFTGGVYNWSWKNILPDGGAIPDYMKLFPIPADVIATYGSSYKQNPGYSN